MSILLHIHHVLCPLTGMAALTCYGDLRQKNSVCIFGCSGVFVAVVYLLFIFLTGFPHSFSDETVSYNL